jgi:LysM repeat protein
MTTAANATAAAAASAAVDAAATSSAPAAESPRSEVTTTEAPASASSDAPAAEAEAPLLVAFWTVQAGDSLSALASEFGTRVKTIIAYNALGDADSIHVGQELAIPVQPGLPVSDGVDVVELSPGEPWIVSWTVSVGDSLLALAYRFGTTVDAIVARNDLSDSSAIYAGQSLAVRVGFHPSLESTPHSLSTNGQDLYNCASFGSWEEAQAVLEANLPGDPNLIDTNGNGIACEALRAR